jgi:hypothetical protein
VRKETDTLRHLTAADFFLLAMPPAGDPEALPSHLSTCASCARDFSEWKKAVKELAAQEADPPADFERAVVSRVRRLRTPRSRRRLRHVVAVFAAAACLLLAFEAGLRVGSFRRGAAPPPTSEVMSARDREDDELLRSVARLISGEENAPWKELAPLPEASRGNS